MWNNSNKKTIWASMIIAGLIFLAVLIWSTIKSPEANAVPGSNKDDRTHAVTVGEWYSLKAGMTRTEVRELLDGPGHVADTQKHTEWYRFAGTSPKFFRVIVSYHNNIMQDTFLVAKKLNGGSFDIPLTVDGEVVNPVNPRVDTKTCATPKEWNLIKVGMTRHEVYDIMDSKGTLSEPQVRQWNLCPRYVKAGHQEMILVWFKKQVVHNAYWLEVG